VATECSWNDGSKAQYYIVILDRLLGRSGGLEWAPEWRVRGPLTTDPQNSLSMTLDVPLQYRGEDIILALSLLIQFGY